MSVNAHQNIGKVKLSARGTFTFTRNKILEYDELPPKYDYQAITGKRVSDKDNLYYIAERLYTEDDFTVSTNANGLKTYKLRSEIPQPTLGGLLGPGDIKYTDVNGDGIIDSYDRVRGIGHPETPEIIYGFGLRNLRQHLLPGSREHFCIIGWKDFRRMVPILMGCRPVQLSHLCIKPLDREQSEPGCNYSPSAQEQCEQC